MTWVGDCPDCFSYREEIQELKTEIEYLRQMERELDEELELSHLTNKKLHRRIELMRKEGNDEL